MVNQQNLTPHPAKEGTTPPIIAGRRREETTLRHPPIININHTTYKDGGINIYRVKFERLLERIGGSKKIQGVPVEVAGKHKASP